MKSKILMLFMILIMAGLATITSCSDDDDGPGICTGVYASEDECKDAIKGADNCKCEPENSVWIAVPD